jgi:HPt (histidine-containing phosphotransfer) domain-containing protein
LAADDDERARELQAFNAEYRESLPQRLRDIDAAWSDVKSGKAGTDTLRTLLRNLHSIAGSALTFGLPALSKAAAAAEDWLDPYSERSEIPPPRAHDTFEPLLAAVRRAASE